MKTHKNPILSILFCATLSIGLVGCGEGCKTQITTIPPSTNTVTGVVTPATTNTTRAFDPVLTSAAIKAVVPFGVSFAVSKEPQARQYLVSASAAIRTFALGQNLTPAALDAVVVSLFPKASDPQTLAAVNAGVGLYEAAYAAVLEQKIAAVPNLVPILNTLADAIDQGLGNSGQ